MAPRVTCTTRRCLLTFAHREVVVLDWELSEESDRFRFLYAVCLVDRKVSVVLILDKVSDMRLLFPSTYLRGLSYVSLTSFTPRLVESPPSLLTTSLVLFPQRSVSVTHVCSFCRFHRAGFTVNCTSSVTNFPPVSRLFLFWCDTFYLSTFLIPFSSYKKNTDFFYSKINIIRQRV